MDKTISVSSGHFVVEEEQKRLRQGRNEYEKFTSDMQATHKTPGVISPNALVEGQYAVSFCKHNKWLF